MAPILIIHKRDSIFKKGALKTFFRTGLFMVFLYLFFPLTYSAHAVQNPEIPKSIFDIAGQFPTAADRSTGSTGCRETANYIKDYFKGLGLETGTLSFSLPVMEIRSAEIMAGGRKHAIHPLAANAITPPSTGPEGFSGQVIYASTGKLVDFDGKPVKNSIVLMELESGKNWINAVNLGAKALIFIDRGALHKSLFRDKFELTPVNFPLFWMPLEEVQELFGDFKRLEPVVQEKATLHCRAEWASAPAENIWAIVPGIDKKLGSGLLIVEAFYDSTALVYGTSPGAGESVGIATMLSMAREFSKNPTGRSVLFLATSGHSQALQGMRESVWALRFRTRKMKKEQKALKARIKEAKIVIKAAGQTHFPDSVPEEYEKALHEALLEQIKTGADRVSRRLMSLRVSGDRDKELEGELALEQRLLRSLIWQPDFKNLNDTEAAMLNRLLPFAVEEAEQVLKSAGKKLKNLKSARAFRAVISRWDEISAMVSLHLSSHGDGVGAFNYGFLYPFRERIDRRSAYSIIDETLGKAASLITEKDGPAFYDTLRPSLSKPWQSWFLDEPNLSGEVGALAGYLGMTLATVNDARPLWGTPHDRAGGVDWAFAEKQSGLVINLVKSLGDATELIGDSLPRNGFSNVIGRAKFIRHGELFPDLAAPGTMIQAYQGPGLFYSMVDAEGEFFLKGVADKKHSYHKVILEGYKFDGDTGQVKWAIDKKQTGKSAYRVKMIRKSMETDLVMFGCTQTTIFDLLSPRGLKFMTKPTLLDGRTDALPLRYWFSRIDTRKSDMASIYLEPGARLKMTLSDSVLSKKLLLTNASPDNPVGKGYPVSKWPFIRPTDLHAAGDMWHLLEPRISKLERHGIFDERIRALEQKGLDAFDQAKKALDEKRYSDFSELAKKSWALAARVYDQVNKTQKDVLFGVLFYIALFVPFSFCLERVLFGFTDIHKRIIGFLGILFATIVVIYLVHPAFHMAYSPMVVILAFFIMGLSLMVSLIIFFRFEEEMAGLQKSGGRGRAVQIGRFKAFTAAFFLGVTNLRRRRLRTALTCITLIILTFTIMSFTTVKSVRRQARVMFSDTAPYHGLLLKNLDWRDLPDRALSTLENAFEGKAGTVPRVWLETEKRTAPRPAPLRKGDVKREAMACLGLSHLEPQVTGIDKVLAAGKWFEEGDTYSVILPDSMARELGIDADSLGEAQVHLWGMPFKVRGIFNAEKFSGFKDLDGEIMTPVIFPSEEATEISEVEMEALESGEDLGALQSRCQHISTGETIILPAKTLLSMGGKPKAVAVKPLNPDKIEEMAIGLNDRFAISIFSGEKDGVFLYKASDSISYSGAPNIIIPIIISVLIVLNTMITSVVERKREIGVYTSVGLAPSHVGFLFVAEALAFAVLSVVFGYLAAQVLASLFAGTSLWAGITVNYSSLAGVAAMALIILVVLASVIYPAKVAANIAIPDVNKAWSLPDAEDGVLSLTLPFLMRESEKNSIAGFIYSHFEGNMDLNHGLYATGGLSLKKEPEIGIKARVWLAPFDFGIHQNVELNFKESADNPGFLEISVRILRETGEANAWRRVNKAFLDNLRKEILLWRSLGLEEKMEFEAFLKKS